MTINYYSTFPVFSPVNKVLPAISRSSRHPEALSAITTDAHFGIWQRLPIISAMQIDPVLRVNTAKAHICEHCVQEIPACLLYRVGVNNVPTTRTQRSQTNSSDRRQCRLLSCVQNIFYDAPTHTRRDLPLVDAMRFVHLYIFYRQETITGMFIVISKFYVLILSELIIHYQGGRFHPGKNSRSFKKKFMMNSS